MWHLQFGSLLKVTFLKYLSVNVLMRYHTEELSLWHLHSKSQGLGVDFIFNLGPNNEIDARLPVILHSKIKYWSKYLYKVNTKTRANKSSSLQFQRVILQRQIYVTLRHIKDYCINHAEIAHNPKKSLLLCPNSFCHQVAAFCYGKQTCLRTALNPFAGKWCISTSRRCINF